MVYTVDHRYADDRDTRDQAEITLSYTFFPAANAAAAAREAKATGGARPPAAS